MEAAMQVVPLSLVRSWVMYNNNRVPRTVSVVCPHCGEKGNFSPGDAQDDTRRLAVSATGACPACNGKVHFLTLRAKQGSSFEPVTVYMHPSSSAYFPAPELPSNVPEPLQRAFSSTIDSLNSKNYTATAVGARRTLEGIFQFLVKPDDTNRRRPTLSEMIQTVTNSIDLAKPLKSLAHGIRGGGNLGAHFDPTNEPSAALARQMVELLDYLISYLYVLPQQIERLEQSLGRSNTESATAEDGPSA
jgi:hypothetical protein